MSKIRNYDLYQDNLRTIKYVHGDEPREVSIYALGKALKNSPDMDGQMANLLEDVMNGFHNHYNDGLEIGRYLSRAHRTLQGCVVNWALGILCGLAEQKYGDLRNEHALTLCRLVCDMVAKEGTQRMI
jgi:hypothetical protein